MTSQAADQQPAPQRGLLVIYSALMLALLLAALDQTIVATALPTIVSPTLSGVYLLPMVGGLPITSVTSGQLIARTGRYKIYPIIGTAVLVVALFLLSRLDENTPTALMSVYFFALGFALGLILQVLVIAVQNSADYTDLGAATSGVTFFRSIGGAFGVSVFGAIFSNQLARELAAALRGVTLPPGFNPASSQANPALLKTLPAALRDAIGHAYSLALHPVFLWAIPLAVVAFILSWFLREVPLRTTSSVGIGEGLGATPPARSSVDEVERSLVRLGAADIRRRGYERLTALAGLDLPAGSSWILTRLAKQGPVRSEDLARQAKVTLDYGKPFVDRLVEDGMVVRSDGTLVLTERRPRGRRAAVRGPPRGPARTARRLVARGVRRTRRAAHETVPGDARCRRRSRPHSVPC